MRPSGPINAGELHRQTNRHVIGGLFYKPVQAPREFRMFARVFSINAIEVNNEGYPEGGLNGRVRVVRQYSSLEESERKKPKGGHAHEWDRANQQ